MTSFDTRRDRRQIAVSIENWLEVEDEVLSNTDATRFRQRKEAILLYVRGFSLKKVREITQISAKDLYRFMDRCEAPHSDGRPNGWRGIIPEKRVAKSLTIKVNDESRLGHANQFSHFLYVYPEIKSTLEALTINGKRAGERGPKRKLSVKQISKELIIECRKVGLSTTDYPMNVASEAYGSVRRFVAHVRAEIAGNSVVAGGVSNLPLVTRCYQRIEADGHWKDVACTIELPSPTGRGFYYLPIDRLWIIPALESQSTCALGYSIAYGHNYSGGDLVRAIRSATLPWIPLELTASGLKYCENGGFPSGLDAELSFVCCDEILLDNHKGHLSDFSIAQIHRTIGATPVFGSINNPNARACAEGFFAKLEAVLHTLPSSIGSTPNNRDIKDPAKNAIKYKISDQHIHEIAEVVLARYNSESPPGSSLSRIEILQRYVSDPRSLVRRIPMEERENISLYDLELEWTIKGNVEKGIPPHGYYLESKYTNPVIASSYGLIGKKLRVYGYSHDIRSFDAYFESGASAGTLCCERRFRGTAHSMQTRKHANASRRAGSHRSDSMGDEIAGYKESLITKAPTSKPAATELARINAEARDNLRRQKQQGKAVLGDTVKNNVVQEQEITSDIAITISKLGTQF